MNKKNLFLGLALLLCANQASAGWMDSVKSAAGWVVSWMPESWQGRACVALGVCAFVGGAAYLSRGNSISMAEAKRLIDAQTTTLSADEKANVETDCSNAASHSAFVKAYNKWNKNDELVEAYRFLMEQKKTLAVKNKPESNKYLSWANEILEVWVEKALNKKVFDSKKNRNK